MKNHFDISGSIEIREVDIAGVACMYKIGVERDFLKFATNGQSDKAFLLGSKF